MLQMIVHKDVVINVKSSSIKGYLDKIVALTHAASSKDSLVGELEASLSRDKALVERKDKDTSSILKGKDDKLRKLESKLEALHNQLCSCTDTAAANEERLSDELSTLHEIVENVAKGDELVLFLPNQLEHTQMQLQDVYCHDSTIHPKLNRLVKCVILVPRQAHICHYDVMQAFCETSLLPPASEAIASTFARFHILAGGSNINTKKRF
ncbi:hypothetical protein Tco_1102356 [Tanacetum coccineum]